MFYSFCLFFFQFFIIYNKNYILKKLIIFIIFIYLSNFFFLFLNIIYDFIYVELLKWNKNYCKGMKNLVENLEYCKEIRIIVKN